MEDEKGAASGRWPGDFLNARQNNRVSDIPARRSPQGSDGISPIFGFASPLAVSVFSFQISGLKFPVSRSRPALGCFVPLWFTRSRSGLKSQLSGMFEDFHEPQADDVVEGNRPATEQRRGLQAAPFAPAADDGGQGFIDKGEQAGR